MAIHALSRGYRQSYYYRFGAVLHNLVSSLVLLMHDPDLVMDTPPRVYCYLGGIRREPTVRISLRGHLIKDPPPGRGGTIEPLQSDLIRSELE